MHDKMYTDEELRFFSSQRPVSTTVGINKEESVRVGRAVRAIPKQCWFNARKAILKLEDYATASYIEGWVVLDGGLWIEHGWVVRDDEVIDPTLPDGVVAYFPGLEFRGREEIHAFLASPQGREYRQSPFFYAYGWGGRHSQSMQAAMKNAEHFATDKYAGPSTGCGNGTRPSFSTVSPCGHIGAVAEEVFGPKP
jgi:hypothetical protein